MAKKVRRAKKKKKSTPVVESTAEQTAEKDAEQMAASSVKTSSAKLKAVSGKAKSAESFRQEYAYVIKDLRRLLLLSGAMFILLIALNLLLQV